ncbi:MAG: secretion system protein E, partial [Methanoculleus sp.]
MQSNRQESHDEGGEYEHISNGSTAAQEEERSALTPLLNRILCFRKTGRDLEGYDPAVHGHLVDAALPPAHEELERYWVAEGLALTVIARNTQTNLAEYFLFEPVLSEFEYELLERLFEDLRDILILDDHDLAADRRVVLSEKAQGLFQEYGLTLTDTSIYRLRYYLERNFLGWSRIDGLMKDPWIEDISCDGVQIPLFLYHRKYHNIRTTIRFDEPALNSLAITLAQRSGKHVSIGSPLVDATLPDGSRLQLTFGDEITPRGTSFTIRKFRETPFTPVELIESNTFDVDQ